MKSTTLLYVHFDSSTWVAEDYAQKLIYSNVMMHKASFTQTQTSINHLNHIQAGFVSSLSGYGQSKWVAEQLLGNSAREHGLRVCVARLGLVGALEGPGEYCNGRDWMRVWMRAVQLLGVMPDADMRPLQLLPVDRAAVVLATLAHALPTAKLPKHEATTLHIVGQGVLDMAPALRVSHDAFAALRRALVRVCGERIRVLSMRSWQQQLLREAAKPGQAGTFSRAFLC